jgi:hypothetical protein
MKNPLKAPTGIPGFDAHGVDVATSGKLGRMDAKVTNERVTSGVKRLDTMLGGEATTAAPAC